MNDLKIIQDMELSILKFFCRLLDRYNLRYYLGWGTLLGAVRHGGFIPWDDDIDIVMPREDYNKLIALPDSVFDPPFRLHEITRMDDYYELYAKLVNTSVSISLTERQRRKGNDKYLWVDIFPLDGLPENRFKLFYIKKASVFLRRLYKLSISDYTYKRSRIKNFIMRIINPYLSHKKIYNIFLKTISKYPFYCSKKAASITEMDNSLYIYPTDVFGSPLKSSFEDGLFNIPENAGAYLKITYGDYMTPPPENERVSGHSFILSTDGHN
jgi:lipopolysaccharide cholinephosphotransferase